MKKLMVSMFALAAMSSVAMAGELVPLTSSQLDAVAAGNPCSTNRSATVNSFANCIQSNLTTQVAAAVGGCTASACIKSGNARAKNDNKTTQVMGDKNRVR
jgi:hypothetical protein